jgi:ferredoxin
MIQIAVDDKACVHCALCAEVCPTKVFTYDEAQGLPLVAKPEECFGCLSCSEICPSDALDHQGLTLSEAYYHDEYAVHLASRLSTTSTARYWIPGDADHRSKALRDLAVRLLSVAAVFRQTVGSGLPAVGSLAGRTLARHLPRYRSPRNLDEALELTRTLFAPAWELVPRAESENRYVLEVRSCFVRELCQAEKIPLGGDLCVLFFNYLAGYLGKMAGVRLRQVDVQRGEKLCSYTVTVHR